MAQLVFVLGRPGTGKSTSLRNFEKDELAIVNVQGKILPFREGSKFEQVETDDSDAIKKAMDKFSKTYKSIAIDDFQYVMGNEFMRRGLEKGYDKFTEIGMHAWEVIDHVRKLPKDVIVYILCHIDSDSEGVERLKTIGRMLDDKIFLEGMATIVLKSVCQDGKYFFTTQNSGKDTIKTPFEMFSSYAIENDLAYVDAKIRNYYGLGEHKSDEEMAKDDEIKSIDSIQKPEGRKKRKTVLEDEKKAVRERNAERVVRSGFKELKEGEKTPFDDSEEVPFDEVEMPKLEEMPKRKAREEKPEEQEEKTTRRRRRDVE